MSLGYINDRAIRWRNYSNFLPLTFYGNYYLRDLKASVIPDNGIVELSQLFRTGFKSKIQWVYMLRHSALHISA